MATLATLAAAAALAVAGCGNEPASQPPASASPALPGGDGVTEDRSSATPDAGHAAGEANVQDAGRASQRGERRRGAAEGDSTSAEGGSTAKTASDGEASEGPGRASRGGSGAPSRPALAPAGGAHPVAWVRRGARVKIKTEPGGNLAREVGTRTEFGSPTVFGVVRRVGPWAAVTTQHLPNDRLGWIRLDPERLRFGSTRMAILIDLSDRKAWLYAGGKAIRAFPVTVGAPGSSTPTGRFAVTDTFRGLDSSAYGCCALALSATQPTLPSGWLGGDRIAIHGTDDPLGTAASHGCVRAADHEVSELIDRVPLGAPVLIRQ